MCHCVDSQYDTGVDEIVPADGPDLDWEALLDKVAKGSEPFEPVYANLQQQIDAELKCLEENEQSLHEEVERMQDAFNMSLEQLTTTGNAMTLATRMLERNRETIMKKQHPPAKDRRHAAEELVLCRSAVLATVQRNGEVLGKMQVMLGDAHRAVGNKLQLTLSTLQLTMGLFQHATEVLRIARLKGMPAPRAAPNDSMVNGSALLSAQKCTMKVQEVSKQLQTSRRAYRQAIITNQRRIQQSQLSLRDDQWAVFGWALNHVSEVRKYDRDFIMAVVMQDGEALEHAPAEFRCDREIVNLAVQQSNGWALQFAGDTLQHDLEIVLAAVRRCGWALEHASSEMKSNRDVVLAAVETDGEALEHAAEEVRGDPEVVRRAVLHSGGLAMRFASSQLQKTDAALAVLAVQQNGLMLEHIHAVWRNHYDVVLAAVQANGMALEHAAERLQKDRRIVSAAIKSKPHALQFAAPPLRGDRNLVLAAVQIDGEALEFASAELRGNRSIVLAAVKQSGGLALRHATTTLQCDPKMISASQETACERCCRDESRWDEVADKE